uniref:Uncharacterized protein n=1 Tax=Wuchereria bancrofti TaxID=6293 RepID=A0AAF5RT30_WUCBA
MEEMWKDRYYKLYFVGKRIKMLMKRVQYELRQLVINKEKRIDNRCEGKFGINLLKWPDNIRVNL